MVDHQVQINGLLPAAQIADIRLEPGTLPRQLDPAVGIKVAPAQEDLHQLDLPAVFTASAHLRVKAGPFRRILHLHQADPGVFSDLQLRAHRQMCSRAQRLDHGHGAALRRLHPNRLAAVRTAAIHADKMRGLFLPLRPEAGLFQGAGLRLFPGERRLIHAQKVPGPGGKLIDQNRITHIQTPFPVQPMLPFISRRIRLFISTAYSTGSSLETLSAKPLTISARASSSLMPRLIR